MGWFENQIEERRAADQQILEESFVKIAGVVLGQRTANRISDERIVTKGAIDEILNAITASRRNCRKKSGPPRSSWITPCVYTVSCVGMWC